MKKLYVWVGGLLILGLVYWVFGPSTQPVPTVKNGTVVWLGDSIGAGYGATDGNSPPEHLARQLDTSVINESTNGDTTSDGVSKIEKVLSHDPGLVIIQLGGNDALRQLPQTETEANLRTMIEAFLANDSAVVLVGIRSGILGDQYNSMFATLADDYELIYVPDALQGLMGRSEYMSDQIHPNDAGSEILAERVFAVVEPIYR